MQAAFLRGLFSTDGAVKLTDGAVSYSTSNLYWAEYVQTALLSLFGVESRLVTIDRMKQGGYPTNKKFQYVVAVRGPRADFIKSVGFCYPTKQEVLEGHAGRPGKKVWSRVASLEPCTADVVDFEVEEDHSYVANGLMSHNSVDSMQLLRQQGFTVGKVSMDLTVVPYETLKGAFYSRRILAPPHPKCQKEILMLEKDTKTGKVDHLAQFSKDVADALAGMVYGISTRREIWSLFDTPIMSAPRELFASNVENSEVMQSVASSLKHAYIKHQR